MTPGQLVHAVAIALDVSEETVAVHDRNLAIAGLRSKGGRGTSAAQVTPRDAARLFVTVLASLKTRDSVQKLREFEQLKFRRPESYAEKNEKFRSEGYVSPLLGMEIAIVERTEPILASLPPDHNLVDALAALIVVASVIDEDLQKYLDRFAPLLITCQTPRSKADIWHSSRPRGFLAHYQAPPRESEGSEPTAEGYARAFGLSQTRQARGSAIILLGMAFREGGLRLDSAGANMDALLASRQKPKKNPTAGKRRSGQ